MNWITKEGKVIPIHKMSDTHLLNTAAMLERTALAECTLHEVEYRTELFARHNATFKEIHKELVRRGLAKPLPFTGNSPHSWIFHHPMDPDKEWIDELSECFFGDFGDRE